MKVSYFESANGPLLRIPLAPAGRDMIHYPNANVDITRIFNGIASGSFENMLEAIKKLGYDDHKKQLPCFTPSGVFRFRKDTEIVDYSRIIHLDYDKVESVVNLKAKIKKMPYTLATFLSPSWKGVKVFVKVATGAAHHAQAFSQVKKHYDEVLGVNSDSKVKNISRLCFVSVDRDLYLNENSKVFKLNTVKETRYVPAEGAADKTTVFGWLYDFTLKKMPQGFSDGNRNEFLYLFACNCNRYGLSEQAAMQYMLWINDSSSDGIPDRELLTTHASAYKNAGERGAFKLPANLKHEF